MDEPHILIVDDDERLRGLLTTFLRRSGFLVSRARDAAQARRLLEGLEFDLVVLDVMMPGEDGISFCRDLHAHMSVPVLLLTARSETGDRIAGLEAGADDYLAKPFDPKELLLRINAILRRIPQPAPDSTGPTQLRLGTIVYDTASGDLRRGEELINLTGTEVELMQIFTNRLGEPLSRAFLVSAMGRDEGQAQERAVDVQITRLRRKIEDDPKRPRYLQTVRGEGYRLTSD